VTHINRPSLDRGSKEEARGRHSSDSVACDVLIVGAGPVGLFLANECARRGLRWRLIEARATQSVHSKALAIFPRTLEILDMAGVVQPFLDAANRVTWVAIVAGGRQLARIRFAPDNTPYPFVAMVPQDVTERILAGCLAERGGRVEYETKLVSAVQDDGRVRATLQRDGRTVEVTAGFLVGCDGAHSTVRHLLELPFAGEQYDASFLLADIETNDALPADEMQLCPSEFGPLAIFPMSATRRRVVATVAQPENDSPSLELVRKLLAQRAPQGISALSLKWSSYFRIHHRQVDSLRVGRMFVAGDAAHIHSPFGGQGMNTGLQDVWNLAWKVDLVVRGKADERILDSYTMERRPVIRNVIATTDFITRAMGTASKPAQLLRNVALPIVARISAFQRRFVGRLSELDISYRGSPLVVGDGRRCFDDGLRKAHGRFVLLLGERCAPSTLEAAERLAALHTDILECRVVTSGGIALVRPDGYVAYAEMTPKGASSVETAQAVLNRSLGDHPGRVTTP
jgi:2-polyprenyl-6-methoxyphenol hydroxylase-like FAD-dependent oxidoreductase